MSSSGWNQNNTSSSSQSRTWSSSLEMLPHLMSIETLANSLREIGMPTSALISLDQADLVKLYVKHVQPKPPLTKADFPPEVRELSFVKKYVKKPGTKHDSSFTKTPAPDLGNPKKRSHNSPSEPIATKRARIAWP